MSDTYSENLRDLIESIDKGSISDSRHILEEFVNHHLNYHHPGLDEGDKMVLAFVVRAIRSVLEGVEPRKALCLTSGEGGRPKEHHLLRDIALTVHVSAKLEEGFSTARAQKAIADSSGYSVATVRAAWDSLGGRREGKKLRSWFPEVLPKLPIAKKRGGRT